MTDIAHDLNGSEAKVISGPTGLELLRYSYNMRKDPLTYLSLIQKKYGDIVVFPVPTKKIYFLSDPAVIGQVLLATEKTNTKSIGYKRLNMLLGNGLLSSTGKIWSRQRRLANPAFHGRVLEQLVPTIREETNKLIERMRREFKSEKKFDMSIEMSKLTFTIIGKILFSMDLSSEAKKIKDALGEIQRYATYLFYTLWPIPLKVPLLKNIRASKALNIMNEIVYRIIDEHKRHPDAYQDLLSVYLQTEDEDGNRMPLDLIRDEVITLMLAGHDTTAVSIALSLWQIAQEPEIGSKIVEELSSLPNDYKMSDVMNLDLSNRVFQEITRLFPAAWAIGRQPLKDVTYGGYVFEKGSQIILSQYHTHRNPRHWDRPDKFDPDRFLPENSQGRHPFAFFPFGGGQRVCIGSNLAKLEANIITGSLVKNFNFSWDSKDSFQLQPKISLLIEPNLLLKATPR